MCKQYGINACTYRQRLGKGWSVKDALTQELDRGVVDHLGNKYKNQEEMCRHYGIPLRRFTSRLSRGATIKEALSPEKHAGAIKIEDNLGNRFNSIKDICKHYEISEKTLKSRIQNLVELEVALVVKGYVTLAFIGLDGKARYYLNRSNEELYTARELIAKYRPDFLLAYDKNNPTGKYEPYKPNKEDNTHE